MKIQEVIVKKFDRKSGDYSKIVNVFEKYTVEKVEDTKIGKAITINGPRKSFRLYQNVKGLTIVLPPKVDGESAKSIKVPLFYVSPMMNGAGSIQGCQYFALINDELVAYRNDSVGLSPMNRNFDYSILENL